jgi:hypothetical protein
VKNILAANVWNLTYTSFASIPNEIILFAMMLAYWRLTTLPPVGAISVTENSGPRWAYVEEKNNGTPPELTRYMRTASITP